MCTVFSQMIIPHLSRLLLVSCVYSKTSDVYFTQKRCVVSFDIKQCHGAAVELRPFGQKSSRGARKVFMVKASGWPAAVSLPAALFVFLGL